jgi:hypothetical protein
MVYLKCDTHHLLRAQAIRASALRGSQDSVTERLRNTGQVSCLEQTQRVGGFRFDEGHVVAFFE